MARRRDARSFGPGPYVLGLRWDRHEQGFPFDVPAMAAVETISLDAPVTLLAGDNGTGKSTVVEALAGSMGFADAGGELERSGALPAVPRSVFEGALEPILSASKPRNGYFLRAESFFNIAAFVDSGDKFAPDLSLYGDVPLHEQSHGQSFLALAGNRFGANGLYILDEPEAALSVSEPGREPRIVEGTCEGRMAEQMAWETVRASASGEWIANKTAARYAGSVATTTGLATEAYT